MMESFNQVVSRARCDFIKSIRSAIAWQISGHLNKWYEEPSWCSATGFTAGDNQWWVMITHDTSFVIQAKVFRPNIFNPEVQIFSFLEIDDPSDTINRVVTFILEGAR